MIHADTERFQRLLRDCGCRSDTGNFAHVIALKYQESWRHYHTLQHLNECLLELDRVRPEFQNADLSSIEMALWFHDLIYDPKRGDNEEESASAAHTFLTEHGAPSTLVHKVEQLILATKHHAATTDTDTALLLDIDLCILGRPPERFAEYEDQIRREYSWVPQDLFVKRRSEIVKRFLNATPLFQTEQFQRDYADQARLNLQQSLDRMSL